MVVNSENKIELMAPAGNFESLQAALDNGADSVYFGVEQLNMRARASINFTLDDLQEISDRCRAKNVRTYLTLNTIIYDHDLSIVKTLIRKAKEAKITAVIAMDQAVIAIARQEGMEVHISTQINVTNIETLKFYAMFADTVVLSRELSLRQVKKITEQIEKEQIKGPSGRLVEIEIFGHGALCMAVSGKCYLSLHSHNSSANRGACKQNCRKKYTVIDQESGFEMEIDNEYIMSPKDLCTIDILDQVADAGIKVLKIEGRGRAPEYVAKVSITCVAKYFYPHHTKRRIFMIFNRIFLYRLCKTGPTGTRLELMLAFENRCAAACADVGSFFFIIQKVTGEGIFRSCLSQHIVLHVSQFGFPLRIGFGNRILSFFLLGLRYFFLFFLRIANARAEQYDE